MPTGGGLGRAFGLSSRDYGPRSLLDDPTQGTESRPEPLGLYPTKETRDDPDICLRTCSWEKTEDDLQYEGAANKRMYILSDKQLKAKITFANLRNCREIKQLIDDAITMGTQCLALKDCQRKNPPWMKLDCEMVSHYSPWSGKFSYYLSNYRSDIFENWVSCWQTAFDGIDVTHSSSPDGTVRISYDMSLPERISSLADA